jgi:hypothetical protein
MARAQTQSLASSQEWQQCRRAPCMYSPALCARCFTPARWLTTACFGNQRDQRLVFKYSYYARPHRKEKLLGHFTLNFVWRFEKKTLGPKTHLRDSENVTVRETNQLSIFGRFSNVSTTASRQPELVHSFLISSPCLITNNQHNYSHLSVDRTLFTSIHTSS